MSRLSKQSLYAVLDRAAKTIREAGGPDGIVSRKDLREKLFTLRGSERSFVNAFYRFMDARDARKGARITAADVEAAVAYAKNTLIDKLDLNNNGLSNDEIAQMDGLGQAAVAFAKHLKRGGTQPEDLAVAELIDILKDLTQGVIFTGFGSEGDDPIRVVHLPANLQKFDAQALADLLGFDTSTAEHALERVYPYSPELSFELYDTIYKEGDYAGLRAVEITRYMTTYLRDLTIVIFGKDLESPPAHPWFWAGRATDGSVVALRSVVIWT